MLLFMLCQHNIEFCIIYCLNSSNEAGDNPAVCSDGTDNQPEEEDNNKLSLISWNVDGLDTEEQPERARGLCSYLIS